MSMSDGPGLARKSIVGAYFLYFQDRYLMHMLGLTELMLGLDCADKLLSQIYLT